MGALSLRLSDELERQLCQEASLSGQPRSQLIREALEALLARRRRERSEAALMAAARALASDPGAREEVQALEADFLPAERELLEQLEAEEGSSASEPAAAQEQPWWR